MFLILVYRWKYVFRRHTEHGHKVTTSNLILDYGWSPCPSSGSDMPMGFYQCLDIDIHTFPCMVSVVIELRTDAFLPAFSTEVLGDGLNYGGTRSSINVQRARQALTCMYTDLGLRHSVRQEGFRWTLNCTQTSLKACRLSFAFKYSPAPLTTSRY